MSTKNKFLLVGQTEISLYYKKIFLVFFLVKIQTKLIEKNLNVFTTIPNQLAPKIWL